MSYVIALSAVTTTTEQEYLANKKRVHLSLLCLTADLCSTKILEETMSTHAHLVLPDNLSPDLTMIIRLLVVSAVAPPSS